MTAATADPVTTGMFGTRVQSTWISPTVVSIECSYLSFNFRFTHDAPVDRACNYKPLQQSGMEWARQFVFEIVATIFGILSSYKSN